MNRRNPPALSPSDGQETGTALGGGWHPVEDANRWSPDQRFRREERRYLLGLDRMPFVSALLDGHAEPRAYGVRTVYLGSRGPTKWRIRYYDGGFGWLERKRRRGYLVVKHRQMLGEGDDRSLRMSPVAGVTYQRLAWEFDGIRVTLDSDVREGWSASASLRTLDVAVLEVKGKCVPSWLRAVLPQRARSFSKRKWASARNETRQAVIAGECE